MMSNNRVKFEEQIMDCWNVTTDLHTIFEAVGDRPTPLTEDEIMNTLLGMKQLYSLKFEKLFAIFEQDCKELRQMKDSSNSTEIDNGVLNQAIQDRDDEITRLKQSIQDRDVQET